MKITIKETGAHRELYIANENGIEWTHDFIGNHGALTDGQFTLDEDEARYIASKDTYAWWANIIQQHKIYSERASALEAKHGEAAMREALHAGQSDLGDYYSAAHKALDEYFGYAGDVSDDGGALVFDFPRIERRLLELGSTPAEADALTTILHEEGWGGLENQTGDFKQKDLSAKLDWYRDVRAPKYRKGGVA